MTTGRHVTSVLAGASLGVAAAGIIAFAQAALGTMAGPTHLPLLAAALGMVGPWSRQLPFLIVLAFALHPISADGGAVLLAGFGAAFFAAHAGGRRFEPFSAWHLAAAARAVLAGWAMQLLLALYGAAVAGPLFVPMLSTLALLLVSFGAVRLATRRWRHSPGHLRAPGSVIEAAARRLG